MSGALTTRSADESKRNIFLVGRVEHQIVGAKLPSKRQVLQVFFFHMRFRGLNKRESARMVLREVQLFWQKARINMSQESWCIEKIEKMYNTWDGIRKHADRDTETQKRAEDSFVDGLDDLFDFAHADALNKMRNEEDRAFLLLQRQKGRPGSMIGVDVVLTHREQRTAIRKEAEENRKRKYDEMMQAIDATLPADEVDEPEADFHVPSDVALRESTHMEDLPVVKRGRKHFIDARLAGALDQAKITDGMSIHVLIAMAKALFSVGLLNCSVEELVINRSSVRRQRIAYREDENRKIQAEFIENLSGNQSVVVHWDGKMLPDITGREKVERIAVLVSFNGTSKFLGAPKLESSTGENIAIAVHGLLMEWNLIDRVKAMAFDTTSSNTGIHNGACNLLQSFSGLELMPLPCRHHIYEILLRDVFELKLGKSSAPEVPVFERFATAWKHINKKIFKNGLEDVTVRSAISDSECDDIKKFCRDQLTKNHCRADYKEMLELVLAFLGDTTITFRSPGPTSHARFMGKAIYDLKIFLFREQFQVSKVQWNGIRDVCIFIIRLYVRAWFGCTNAIASPNQDINFMKDCIRYAQIDAPLSAKIVEKMGTHLWYLSHEAVALAFFDSSVPLEEKRAMIGRLTSETPAVMLIDGRKLLHPENISQYNLSDFVSIKTKMFFVRFDISAGFLDSDPSTWASNAEFQKGLEFCRNLFVDNDVAERGVKFMKDFNRVLTNDEEGKQFLFQAIENYRKKHPNYHKSCLV